MGATTAFLLRSLRRSWRLLAAATLVGALAGGVTSVVLPARYRATAYLLGGKAGTDPIDSTLLIGESAVYARVATDPTIMAPALQQAGLRIDPVHLGRFVTAAADPDSPLLAITATTGSASEAATLANAVAQRMASYSQGFADDTGYALIPLAQALPAVAPTGPRGAILAEAGAALGLLLAALVVVVRQNERLPMDIGPPSPVAPRRSFLTVLLSRWWVVVLALSVGVAGGVAGATARTPRYQSTAYLIGVRWGAAPIAQSLLIGESKAFARVVYDPGVVGPALQSAGFRIQPTRLRTRLTTASDPNDPLLGVTASADSATAAAQLANVVASSVSAYSGTLHTETGYQLNVFTKAVPPSSQVGPGVALVGALGGVVGALLALLILFVAPGPAPARRRRAVKAPPVTGTVATRVAAEARASEPVPAEAVASEPGAEAGAIEDTGVVDDPGDDGAPAAPVVENGAAPAHRPARV